MDTRALLETDARSPKCNALDGAAVCVLGWHPGEAIQLRTDGAARLLTTGGAVDRIWLEATRLARCCSLVAHAPGTPRPAPASGLPADVEGREPDHAELLPACANFAVVMIEICEIDWLHLAQDGHRRVRLCRDGGVRHGEWITPWPPPP